MASPSLSSDRLRTGEFSVILFAMRGAGKKNSCWQMRNSAGTAAVNQEEKGKSLSLK